MTKKIAVYLVVISIIIAGGVASTQVTYKDMPISDYVLAYAGSLKKQKDITAMMMFRFAQGIEDKETMVYWLKRLADRGDKDAKQWLMDDGYPIGG